MRGAFANRQNRQKIFGYSLAGFRPLCLAASRRSRRCSAEHPHVSASFIPRNQDSDQNVIEVILAIARHPMAINNYVFTDRATMCNFQRSPSCEQSSDAAVTDLSNTRIEISRLVSLEPDTVWDSFS